MTGKGIFQRLAPFFLTLMAGIFIAGIFVDVTSPFGFRPLRINRMREMERLRMENDQLRSENQCLRRQISARRLDTVDMGEFTIPPVPAPNADAPPPPPRIASRNVR
jgi:hypothetical protein